MSSEQARAVGRGGQHAVVIGASMAGLLSGRVLSDHFERVTIIERDRLSANVEARKGVPQGRHVHGLLSKGAAILKEYFPDLFPALVQGGASYVDTLADVCWYYFDVWKLQFPSDMKGYSQSRPFLEQRVREHLAARSNVLFIDECEVARLCSNEDNTRVTGVQLRYNSAGHHEEELAADLVVDASGRGSQAPQWLASMGYGVVVKETIVKVDVGYATRIYRRPSQTFFDGKVLVIYPTPPGKRAGYVFPIEDDCWMVTLAGWLRDYPPNDEIGFLDYARSLPVPNLYEAIRDAEPVTPIAIHKFPSSQRRHYERMSRFPENFVVLGDAACSFNPIYGQGITSAALEAKALDACLDRQYLRSHGNLTGFARRYQKAIARVVEVPWLLATGEDFRHRETVGYRSPGMGLLNWYTARVHVLAGSHPTVTLRLYQVLNMLKPPAVLFEPRVLFRVLFKRRTLQVEHEATMKSHSAHQRDHPAEAEQLRS